MKLRTESRGLRTSLLVFFAGGLILAGCGGGGDSTEDLTRNDYIVDADAICAQFNATSATREAEFNQALKSSDLESAAQDFEDQADEADAMLDQLETLTAPVADQATITDLIALGRKRAAAAREAADAIAGGDKDAMIAAGKKGALLAGQYDQLADGFGLVDCGSGGNDSAAGATGSAGATGTTGTTS